MQVLDVGAAEDDVLEDLVAGQHGSIGGSVLGAEGADLGQGDG